MNIWDSSFSINLFILSNIQNMNSFLLFEQNSNIHVQVKQKKGTPSQNATQSTTANFILNENDFNKQTITSEQSHSNIGQIGLELALFTNKSLWGNNFKGLDWVNEQTKRHAYDFLNLNDKVNKNLFSDLEKMIRKQITLIQPSPAEKKLLQLERSGKTFYDDRFPPTRESLCGQSSNPFLWKQVQWRKITDILPNSAIFKDRIEPGDIKQGGLGNCYFLAGLAALAQRPDRIFNLFLLKEKNSVRYYSVKLLYKGKWMKIDMDQYIPCQGNMPAFSNAVNNQLWVVLLEKAWAKMYMNYKNVQSGYPEQSLHDLTGAPVRQIYLKQPNFNKQVQWKYLIMASQKQYSMVASSNPGSDTKQSESGIVQGHAYTLLNATTLHYINGSQRVIQLRNPWGKIEYKGKWSDQDPNWQKVHPQQIQRLKFIKNSNDGIFFMPYDSFIHEFRSIAVAQINDNASYVYKSMKDYNVEGVFFKIQILKEGNYSLQVDKTPERSLQGNILGQYRYPQSIIQLGLICGGGCQKIEAFSSLYRTLYRGYYLKPGIYVAYVKISFDKNLERDFDVNLAIYSEYVCDIQIAQKNYVVLFTGNPNIKWNPENIEKEQGSWNNLGNTLYQKNNCNRHNFSK